MYKTRGVTQKERDHACRFFGCPISAQRRLREQHIALLCTDSLGHGGLNNPWGNRVRADTARPEFQREVPRERNDSGFRH